MHGIKLNVISNLIQAAYPNKYLEHHTNAFIMGHEAVQI